MQRRRSPARWPIDNLHIAPTDSVHLAFVVFAIHFWVDMLSQLEMLFGGPVSTHTHTRHQTHSLVDSSLPLCSFECESFSLLIAPSFSSILSRMTVAIPNYPMSLGTMSWARPLAELEWVVRTKSNGLSGSLGKTNRWGMTIDGQQRYVPCRCRM